MRIFICRLGLYRITKISTEVNLHRIIIDQINVNSVRNKFEDLVNGVRGNVDILIISETKIDDSPPPTQFLIEGFTAPYRLDQNGLSL